MAITCEWKDRVGSVEMDGIRYTMYGGGNVYACICTDEEGGYHTLVDFIVDKEHLKRILSDEYCHWDRYENIRLNTYYKGTFEIAKLLAKKHYTVTLYWEECNRKDI